MAANGYLALITLHRAEQRLTLDVGNLPEAKQPTDKEIKLAEQLVESVAGTFDPFAWRDEHHRRVCELIEAKARGRKVAVKAAKRKSETSDLAAALQRSLAAGAKEKRVG
jgi:DNA end-binding protein Ku